MLCSKLHYQKGLDWKSFSKKSDRRRALNPATQTLQQLGTMPVLILIQGYLAHTKQRPPGPYNSDADAVSDGLLVVVVVATQP